MITPRRAARLHAFWGFLFVGACLCAGCQNRLDDVDQYGETVHQLPTIKGANRPYPLPELEEPKKDSDTEDRK